MPTTPAHAELILLAEPLPPIICAVLVFTRTLMWLVIGFGGTEGFTLYHQNSTTADLPWVEICLQSWFARGSNYVV